ncbi:MAG: hypothetical protein H6541_13735 [Lentimicrobiaceae bacterium]|nr:hypothetical protein [Lentimicrobiaceae bacterium]MCO5265879.1 hypothetical protein [Lentimicrobium sp.]
MRKHSLMLILSIFLLGGSTFAQDLIMKKNNELIKCKIKEIGLDEIKYTLPEYSADVLLSVDKDDVDKIIFENGKEMEFQKTMTNPETYIDNKKNIIKIDFLSPLTGNTTFAYERSLRPGRSMEASFGIIGLGADPGDENAGGAFVKLGYKFIKDPDFYLRGMRYAHILKGGYIKPEIAFGFFSRDEWWYDYSSSYYNAGEKRVNVFSGVFQLVFGKQWVFDNAFAVDVYAGVGYGFTTEEYFEGYHYGYVISSEEFPISFSSGLKIGYLFK